MDMEREQIEKAWQELSERVSRLETERKGGKETRNKTSLENLAARYRRFSTISLVMMFCGPCYMFNAMFDDEWKIWMSIAFCVYFGVASLMDYRLYLGVKSIDVYDMSISEVCLRARRYRRMHHICMLVLAPAAITLVGLMCLAFGADKWLCAAIGFGFAVGLAIGIRQYMAFMNDYRSLEA